MKKSSRRVMVLSVALLIVVVIAGVAIRFVGVTSHTTPTTQAAGCTPTITSLSPAYQKTNLHDSVATIVVHLSCALDTAMVEISWGDTSFEKQAVTHAVLFIQHHYYEKDSINTGYQGFARINLTSENFAVAVLASGGCC